MDRPDVSPNQNEDTNDSEEPVTLDVQDGFIGGTSDYTEGE